MMEDRQVPNHINSQQYAEQMHICQNKLHVDGSVDFIIAQSNYGHQWQLVPCLQLDEIFIFSTERRLKFAMG